MKNHFAAWIVFTFVSLTAAACQNDSAQKPESPPANPDIRQDPVELVFYYVSPADWTEESFMRVFGEPLKKKFPYITPKFRNNVKGSSLEELIAAKEQVDIVFASTGLTSRLTSVNMQYDITPLMKQSNYDETAISPQILDAGRIIAKGGLFGLPVYTVPATMYYNKEIFNKFGQPYPKDGMTWDDVYQISRTITRMDGDRKYYGLRTSLGHLLHLNQFSLHMVEPASARSDFSSDHWKTLFETVVRLYRSTDVPTAKADLDLNKQREAFFVQRNTGMWLALTNLHTSPELDNSFDWDIATFPSFPGKENVGPQPYPTYFHITVTSPHKKQAFDAISYFTSKEFQMQKSREGELLSILKDQEVFRAFGQGDSIYKGKNVQALIPRSYAAPANITDFDATIRVELNKVLFNVIAGESDTNTALRSAQEEANKKIKAALGQ